MHFPSVGESQDRVLEAREQFQRLLAQWASDLLVMRARGNRVPRWTTRRPAASQPVDDTANSTIELDLDRARVWRRAA